MITRVVGVIAIAVFAVACGKKDEGKSETAAASHSYKVRGIVKHVGIGPKKTMLTIHHEAIPDWTNRSGKKMGMMSMSMDFTASPSLDIGGVKAGDKVAFAVDVYYGANTRMEVTSIEKLPSPTELELSKAHGME